MAEFTIDQSFDQWLLQQERALVARTAAEMSADLRRFMPRRTGELIASVRDLPGEDTEGPYEDVQALWIETFQNPDHFIAPKRVRKSSPRFGFKAAEDLMGGRQL